MEKNKEMMIIMEKKVKNKIYYGIIYLIFFQGKIILFII